MFECFHCCKKSVVWDADFDFSDFGLEGEGVVHVCHCTNCGAIIHVMSGEPDDSDEREDATLHASST